jgi:hypothetical protein
MRRFLVFAAFLLACFAAIPGTAASAGATHFPARIDLPAGWAPEGIESGRGTTFYVGSLVDGAIWRGDFRTGNGAVFAPGAAGRVTVGMAYDASRDRLWVAGGGPGFAGLGDVRVYDGSSGALLATYRPAGVGFLNDVTVTRDAVYVTDSFNPQLVVIPLPRNGSLPSPSSVTTLPLSGDYVHQVGQFNLNGIVDRSGFLLAVQSVTGELFRIDPRTGVATAVDLGGFVLSSGDGLELLGHTLYVVRNTNVVTVVRLGPGLTTGTVLGDITGPGLDVPTTGTFAAGRLWVVNARFGTAVTPDTEYWVTQLPARP